MGLTTLFKGPAEVDDHALLQSVKEVRSKSEFGRTAPLGLKTVGLNKYAWSLCGSSGAPSLCPSGVG